MDEDVCGYIEIRKICSDISIDYLFFSSLL